MNPEDFIKELEDRNLIHDCSNRDKLIKSLNQDKKIYLGIDPTFSSLHIGHYFSLSLLRRFEDAGYKTVIILGSFTAVIGDPSFKDHARPTLSQVEVETNMVEIEAQVKKICANAEIIRNHTFYKDLTIPDLLQQICKNVNVNSMISKEFMSNRLATGLTVTEFLYPIFQAYDFYILNKHHDVSVQVGGSDQWGNMIVGIDFIKHKYNSENMKDIDDVEDKGSPLAVVITFPLLLDSNGKKFGKSEGNALFLSPNLTKPYALYQYLLNLADDFASKLLCYFSFLPLVKIHEIQSQQDIKSKKNREIQKLLAKEILSTIYSHELFLRLESISEKLFHDHGSLTQEDFELIAGAIPTSIIKTQEQSNINHVLKGLGFSSSTSESRRLIQDKCISCFNKVITDLNYSFQPEDIKHKHSVIKKGKKDFGVVVHSI